MQDIEMTFPGGIEKIPNLREKKWTGEEFSIPKFRLIRNGLCDSFVNVFQI
jgi:hypothetical protein